MSSIDLSRLYTLIQLKTTAELFVFIVNFVSLLCIGFQLQ